MGTDAVQKYFNLSDDQIQKLHALVKARDEQTHTTMDQLHRKEQALVENLHGRDSDANQASPILAEIDTLRKQLRGIDGEFRSKSAAVLNAEQAQKLKSLEAAAEVQRAIGEAAGLGLLSQPQHGFAPPPPPVPSAQ
jgi:Spy/CpxP family protein refolding chaperone